MSAGSTTSASGGSVSVDVFNSNKVFTVIIINIINIMLIFILWTIDVSLQIDELSEEDSEGDPFAMEPHHGEPNFMVRTEASYFVAPLWTCRARLGRERSSWT